MAKPKKPAVVETGGFRGVNPPSWREVERETGRHHEDLKRWFELYKAYPDFDKFLKEYAGPKAETWTRQALRLSMALPSVETPRLPDCKYQTIVIDPPWDWGDEGDVNQFGRARPPYPTMSFEEIAALGVSDLAAENAHLYLWITNRSLPKGFGLLQKWGFRYITVLTWVKPSFGMGNYFRGTTEHVLFGVRGSLPLLRHDVGTHFTAERPGQHSAKPDAFYELVETCSPGPRLEMFARKKRNGWTVWGAEVAAGN